MSQNSNAAQQQQPTLQWSENEKFELSGKEFEFLINSIRMILASPESQKVLLLAQASDVLERVVQTGIKEGKIVQTPTVDGSDLGPDIVEDMPKD